MQGALRLARVVAPLAVATVALWLTTGALAPIPEGGTSRLGVLPRPWLPLVLLAFAVGLGALLRVDPRRLRPLYLSGVLLLPWLPAPVPAPFLVWHGALAWAVWAAITAALLAPAMHRAGQRLAELDPGIQSCAAILLAAALYMSAAWRMAPVLPDGDEPHYLVIAQSLLYDGDLKIENNHRRRDFMSYAGHELRPHYLRRGLDGEIYSIHAPGLPTLVAPAFALAGYPGVVVLLSFLAALGAGLVWRAAWRLTGDAGAAWIGWAAVALSVPFFFQAFTVFPDSVGAVAVMTAVYALLFPERLDRPSRCLLHGLAPALLPWLHTRYALPAGVLGLLLASRAALGERAGARLAAVVVVPLLSAAGWLGMFYLIYGTVNPAAPYANYTQTTLENAPGGLTGLLFDQQFGILPNAPVYVLAALGLSALWRHQRRLGLEIAYLVGPYVVSVASYHMWWGGRSSPGRFAVPVLLPLGVGIALLWTRSRSRADRASIVGLIGGSAALALVLAWVDRGALVYNVRDGYGLWLDAAAPLVNLPLALPTLFRGPWPRAATLGLLWLGTLAAGWLVMRLLDRWRAPDAPPGSVTRFTVVTAGVVMLGATVGWAAAGADPLEPGTGLARVVRAAPRSFIAVSLPSLALNAPHRALGRLHLPSASRHRDEPDAPLFVGRDLPPARYFVVIEGSGPASGVLSATVGPNVRPFLTRELTGVRPGELEMAVDLPAGARRLVIAGDGAAQRTIARVALRLDGAARRQLTGLVPEDRADARIGARYGPMVVWFLDEGGFAEQDGFWVRGHGEAALVLAPEIVGRQVPVRIRNGAVPNRARVAVGTWTRDLALEAGEVQDVEVPLPAHARAVAVRISSESGFRPSEVDPSSSDARLLGVWVAAPPDRRHDSDQGSGSGSAVSRQGDQEQSEGSP